MKKLIRGKRSRKRMASQKRIKTSDIYANDCESKYGLDSVSSATWIAESKLNQWDQEDFGGTEPQLVNNYVAQADPRLTVAPLVRLFVAGLILGIIEVLSCIPLLDESLHIPRPLPKDRRESRLTSSRLQNNPTSGRQELVK
ncbi:hypothetical protein RRG08_052508 [Elysia crispata]|uniref:Uncharacterized protein n=1 Tax=Elysia crispata TaxID=231223 RepID=A0AAE1DFX1_9GAST|nr:hypothetical protein RRG08_052508 [Elysia crispata]